jgi:thiamine-monophosphate kinase
VLELHVFAVGRVPQGKAVLRSGAKPGDRLYVTGKLGGSLLGRHLRVEPRLAEGQWLRENGWVTAMMDVSDGLAADLPRLVKASGVGAVVDAEAVPVSGAARRMGKGGEQRAEGEEQRAEGNEQGERGMAALEHALSDGEDFELLFSVSARKAEAFESGWRKRFRLECTAIGKVTKAAGKVDLVWNGKVVPLTAMGYEHFRKL